MFKQYKKTNLLVMTGMLLLAAGCCPKPAPKPGPDDALRQYVESVRRGQYDKALEIMSDERKEEIDTDRLGSFAEKNAGIFDDTLELLNKPGAMRVELHATISGAEDSAMHLVNRDGNWLLEEGFLIPNAAASPEDALDLFLKYIESGDCESLLSCAPPWVFSKHERSRLLDGCRNQMKSLKEIASKIRKKGKDAKAVAEDRYELTYDKNKKLILVKVADRWYIEDL